MASKTFASPTLSSTPSDIEVITEMDVFEAAPNEGPVTSPVTIVTSVKGFNVKKDEPIATEKTESVTTEKKEPVTTEKTESVTTEKKEPEVAKKEVAKDTPIEENHAAKGPVLKVDLPEDDMPPLVEDSDSSDDDMPALVHSDEDSSDEDSSDEDLLIAVYRRPACDRCDAALHAILDPSDSDEEPRVIRRQDSCPPVITYTAAIFGLFYLIKIYLILTGGAFIVGPGYYGSCL